MTRRVGRAEKDAGAFVHARIPQNAPCPQIYKKLEKELAEKKKEMARIIEVSNKAYEARDAAIAEMARLKAQADKEQAAFEQARDRDR